MKWDWLLIAHLIVLLLLAGSLLLLITNGSDVSVGMIAKYVLRLMILFLFVSIPLGIITLIMQGKGLFSKKWRIPAIVLSCINIGVGITAWFFYIVMLIP